MKNKPLDKKLPNKFKPVGDVLEIEIAKTKAPKKKK